MSDIDTDAVRRQVMSNHNDEPFDLVSDRMRVHEVVALCDEVDRLRAERDDWAREAKKLADDIGLLAGPPHTRHQDTPD